jgi:hypothetical protein
MANTHGGLFYIWGIWKNKKRKTRISFWGMLLGNDYRKQIMKAKSIKGKSTEEIELALKASMTDSFKPTLAIVFLSVIQNRKEIATILDKTCITIFGVTTNGEFTDDIPEKQSTAILLLDINHDYFSLLYADYDKTSYRGVAANLAKEAIDKFSNPAFLIAGSNANADAEAYLLIIGTVKKD